MFNASRLRGDFNAAAKHYDAHAALQLGVLKHLLEKLEPLPENALILDAGCGTGALARELRHTRIIGLDSAQRMCAAAKKSGEIPVTADMNRLPFADACFDIVFSSLALQWSDDKVATLKEWLRVLKPGGTLAFSSFSAGTLQELAASFRAADASPHVSDFMDPVEAMLAAPGNYESETITEHYPDMRSLARHLKALGARNKRRNRRASLMTPRQFLQAEAYYAKHFSDAEGIQVSWNILCGIAVKP